MIRRLERGAALAALGVLAVLHVSFLLHAGALWRDEVNSVNLASLPLGEFWANLQFDSFPVVWFGVLRAWIAVGAGSTDLALRVLGLLLGLSVLGLLWWNARRLGATVPLFSFAFLGFNAAVISYGDSVRANGLGMLTGLLAFGLIWEVVERPDLRRVLAAAAAALLSVHCVFYNALFLLAACAGGAAVALRRRAWKTIALLFVIGLPAALSLLLYRVTIRNENVWNAILKLPIDLAWIWTKFLDATETTGALAPWLWVAFVLASAGIVVAVLVRRGDPPSEKQRDAVLFCGVALVLGTAAYLAFLLELSYVMQPWYFLTLMALVATCLDGILLVPPCAERVRILRLGAAVAVLALALPGAWGSVRVRKTNMDLVAATLAASAARGDLIVVTPWQYGITFDRYYRGAAEWTTVPPVASHKVHRYDLLKQAMMSPDAMRPVLERIESALRSGHRVFWIGGLSVPAAGQGAPVLPPAPQGPWGWRETPHYQGWGMQAGYLFRKHALRARAVPVPVGQPVSFYENLQVSVIEGWRDPTVAAR